MLFRPKHQKLILQCYPPKRLATNADFLPNKSKLSYLIYYASTRRTKLEKVANFLAQKTAVDAARDRLGNIKVTLRILSELIDKCADDIGIFAPKVVEILQLCLTVTDITACQQCFAVYREFCRCLKQVQRQVFSSNYALLKQFIRLTCVFLGFASLHRANRPQTFQDDWLRIAIDTAACVANYIDPPFSVLGVNLIEHSVHILLRVLTERNAVLEVLVSEGGEAGADGDDGDLDDVDRAIDGGDDNADPAASAGSADGADPSGAVSAPRAPSGAAPRKASAPNIPAAALASLTAFFNTSSKQQVDVATGALISYAADYGADVRWVNKLVVICAKRTHIELRYRIVSTMLLRLDHGLRDDFKVFVCDLIATVLSSQDVNLVGLPVKDVLTDILDNQRRTIVDKSAIPDQLDAAYLDVVASLGRHIYYNAQVNDMLVTVFSYYYRQVFFPSEKLAQDLFLQLTRAFIRDVDQIYQLCQDDSYLKYKRAPYPLSMFNFLLYAFPLRRDDGSDVVDAAMREQIQAAWLRVLQEFCAIDLNTSVTANADLCITNNTDNPFCLYLDCVAQALKAQAAQPALQTQIAATSAAFLQRFQINFLMNFLKFSGSWLAESPGSPLYDFSLYILNQAGTMFSAPLRDYTGAVLTNLQAVGQLPSFYTFDAPADMGAITRASTKVDQSALQRFYADCEPIAQWLPYVSDTHAPVVSRTPPKPKPMSTERIVSDLPEPSLVSFDQTNSFISVRTTVGELVSAAGGASTANMSLASADVSALSAASAIGGGAIGGNGSPRSARLDPPSFARARAASMASAASARIASARARASAAASARTPIRMRTATSPTTSPTKPPTLPGLAYSITSLDL